MRGYTNPVAELKDRLRQALEMRGVKAVELSEKTGVPQGAISYYLAGKSQPKADRLYIIAKALDVSEVWLLGYNVPAHRTDEQKKNDHLAEMVVKMRANDKFYDLAVKLSALSDEQLDLIDKLVSGLAK